MPEASLPTARRDEDNTFTGKNRFKQGTTNDGPEVVNAGAGKGVSVTANLGNTTNLIEIVVNGVVAFSITVDASNVMETLSLRPGLNAQGQYDVAGGRYKSGFDGSNAFVDSLNKEVQLRANGVANVRVGQSATLAFYNGTPVVKPSVTGAKGSNAALGSLLTALASLGLVTDSSTA